MLVALLLRWALVNGGGLGELFFVRLRGLALRSALKDLLRLRDPVFESLCLRGDFDTGLPLGVGRAAASGSLGPSSLVSLACSGTGQASAPGPLAAAGCGPDHAVLALGVLPAVVEATGATGLFSLGGSTLDAGLPTATPALTGPGKADPGLEAARSKTLWGVRPCHWLRACVSPGTSCATRAEPPCVGPQLAGLTICVGDK